MHLKTQSICVASDIRTELEREISGLKAQLVRWMASQAKPPTDLSPASTCLALICLCLTDPDLVTVIMAGRSHAPARSRFFERCGGGAVIKLSLHLTPWRLSLSVEFALEGVLSRASSQVAEQPEKPLLTILPRR